MTTPVATVGNEIRHVTMSAAAADKLRRRILDGTLPAGFQLRQDLLAEELGISRIPIREALVQLEAEGLVRIIPHRGAVVSELSLSEIEELFELRALIEPHLLRRSAALLKFLSERRGRRDQAPPLFSGTSRKLILKDKGRAPFRLPAPFFIRVVRFTVSDIYTAIRSA